MHSLARETKRNLMSQTDGINTGLMVSVCGAGGFGCAGVGFAADVSAQGIRVIGVLLNNDWRYDFCHAACQVLRWGGDQRTRKWSFEH
jgi:hypothetical protein